MGLKNMTEYIFVIKKTTHGQFHLIDDEAYPDPSDVWADEACANRLAVTRGFVGIGVPQDQPTGMDWGCGGMIYFWIREADLAARRFNRVFEKLESS